MKLAMRLPETARSDGAKDVDPRDETSAEVIDLASRTAYPAVANRKGKSDAMGLAVGVGFVALLGAATLWGLNASRMSNDEAGRTSSIPAVEPGYEPDFTPPPPLDNLPSANAVPYADPAPSPIMVQGPMAEPGTAINPYASPTLVYDGAAVLTAPAPLALPGEAGTSGGEAAAPGGGPAGDFAARIGGVGGGPATARVDIDPRTTVTQGTMIPAVLETAINTDVPGYVRAVVSQDVRSFDGARILVPRSSRLVGQYQSGLQAGQKRAYVIWTRLIRPDGVSVQLASPATSFDGTAGLEGEVDSHFFQRFGSAMLLSVIGGLTTIASSGASVVLGGGQNAATAAIQQDGQRPPTVRVRMGTPVRVYTARDLDFSRAPRVR